MKRKNNQRALLLGQALNLRPDGTPPSELQLFHAGENPSDYGPIMFDAKAAESVMAAYRKKGNPLFFDWNHGMAVPKEQRTREQGASAGKFELAVRDGGLWAVNCQWTVAGAASLTARDYELFSPFFTCETGDDGVCRPVQLLNCALVNMAGLDHLEPIAAGAALDDDKENDMTPEQIKALQDKLDAANGKVMALEGEVSTLKSKGGVLALAAIVGVSAEADVAPAVTELVKGRGVILALAGAKTVDDAVATIRAWKDSHDTVAALQAKETERVTLALQAEFDAIVDQAVKELKVGGGDVAKEWKATQVALMGGKLTAEGVAATKKQVALMHAKGYVPGRGPTPPSAMPGEITEDQKNLLALHGIKLESAQKAVAAEALYHAAKARQEGRV